MSATRGWKIATRAVVLIACLASRTASRADDPPPAPVVPAPNAAPAVPSPVLPAPSADPEDPTIEFGVPPLPISTDVNSTYVPGEGVTISLLNDTSRLRLSASLSALMIFNTQRPFTSGAPFLLLPASPFGLSTNTFDLHARQSSIFAAFEGPEVRGLTPRATILTFFFNDNLVADNYGLLVYFAYGELMNERMRLAGGLMQDVYNPVSPTVLSLAKLYGSGNTGSYRGMLRLERYLELSRNSMFTMQAAISEPTSTLVTGDLSRINEDDGIPNFESRIALALGQKGEKGPANGRPFEVGLSGVVGRLRTTRTILVPPDSRPPRVVDDVWGFGVDMRWAVTDRFGLASEFYLGQSLGEYNGTILQNNNSTTLGPIRGRGGFGELYFYLTEKLHWHVGYGIDAPFVRDLAPTQFARNQTLFNTLVWDVTSNFQVGFEVDYRKTNYIQFLDNEGVSFLTQFLWKF
ncbi:MAG: hypothetical protein SFX72_22725 [Isosphaeraceae bacterium]|nr:hypothetical protein [Isosphaeraceae bacterium]